MDHRIIRLLEKRCPVFWQSDGTSVAGEIRFMHDLFDFSDDRSSDNFLHFGNNWTIKNWLGHGVYWLLDHWLGHSVNWLLNHWVMNHWLGHSVYRLLDYWVLEHWLGHSVYWLADCDDLLGGLLRNGDDHTGRNYWSSNWDYRSSDNCGRLSHRNRHGLVIT